MRSGMNASLGRHVLIVEDEALIALELESTLKDAGYEIVGPVGTTSAALVSLADHQSLAGAVLDINLGDEDSFPVANALSDAHIPFLFLTGHSNAVLPARHEKRPVVRKPYLAASLLATLAATLAEPETFAPARKAR
jgi:DNA-binding response OmpR family regulator